MGPKEPAWRDKLPRPPTPWGAHLDCLASIHRRRHGATLVHISAERTIRTQFVPTDAVRWHTERVAIEEDATLDTAKKSLADRVKQLRAEADSRPLIVTWKLRGGEHLAGPAGRRDLAAEWQEWLRKDHFLVNNKPGLWTQAVELDQPNLPEGWFEEESMLGDFLRNLKILETTPAGELRLGGDIPDHHRGPALASLVQWTGEEYQAVLYEAGLTGAQLLGAGERES